MTVSPVRATITPLSGTSKGTGIDFHGWHGWVGELEDDMDLYRRPGASGNGGQSLGKEHRKQCNAWRAELNATTAEAWIKSLQAAKGPVVSLKDPYSRVLKRCRIITLEFEPISGRGIQLTGGIGTIVIRVSLQMERLPDG